jgi:flagellar motor switch protein FliM
VTRPPDVLNQKGIDALLQAGDRAVAADEEVHAYSFARPNSLGRRTRFTVETAQAAFARGLEKMLTLRFRAPVSVSVSGVECVYVSDLALSLGSPCAAFLFGAGPGNRFRGVFDWGIEAGLSSVDRLLGGGGGGTPAAARPLTAIEQGILRHLTQGGLGLLAEAWKEILPVGREVLGLETNPSAARFAAAEDRFLVTLFELTGEGLRGTITLGLPMAPLDALLQEKAPAPAPAPAARAGDPSLLDSGLKHSRLEVAARLPDVVLSMRAVSALHEGQIIDTRYPLDVPVHVHVNGRLLFQGALGQVRGHIGLRITERAAGAFPDRPVHSRQGRVV